MELTSFIQWAKAQISEYKFIEEIEIYLMIEKVTGLSKSQIILNPNKNLSASDQETLSEYLNLRFTGKPLAVILGEKYFYKNSFVVNEHVLIPRPETEIMVEEAIEFLKTKLNPSFLDIGTGSGCIGLSVAKQVQASQGILIEKSEQAFLVTQKNQKIIGISNVKILNSEFKASLFNQMFDLILANPPYIAVTDPEVDPHVRKYEPHIALFADDNGLALIKTWATESAKLLKPKGLLIFEIGYKQGPEVKEFFKNLNFFRSIQIKKDYSGQDRFIFASL
jgi:release factor glutamine methyltransferase